MQVCDIVCRCIGELINAPLVALQMPLRARLCWLHLALHSWWACACTAAQHAHIGAIGNPAMIDIRGHTQANDHSLVRCAGIHAASLAV